MKTKLKIGFTGSREFKGDLPQDVKTLILDRAEEVVHGGAAGFDTAISEFANKHNITNTIIRPEYSKVPFTHPTFGVVTSVKAAPLARNHDIIDQSDIMVGAWKPGSRGTTYTLKESIRLGKPTFMFELGVGKVMRIKAK